MNQEVRVWLPFPPSVNGLFPHAVVKGKIRRFPSKGYKAWRNEAHVLLRMAKIPRFEVPVVIKLELTPSDNRARDASNYIKAVEDALVQARILIDDDQRYVKAVAPYWMPPAAHCGLAGVVVIIRPADMMGKREALTGHERKFLGRLKRDGCRLVRPGYSSNAARALVKKGYAEELPGLLDGIVQGYRPID